MYGARSSPAAELAALHDACARAGCTVASARAAETIDGPRNASRVDCPDGWSAFRLLVALAEADARRPDVQHLARIMRAVAPDDESYARLIHSFVKGRVRFVREVGELFQGTTYTLVLGEGDCDDHARAAYALALAGGLRTRMGGLAKPRASGPSHAVAQLCPNGACAWAETTVDAAFGEHPYAAAQRLGLTVSRSDIATEEHFMSGTDLKTPPASNEQIERDAVALEHLGFLVDATSITGAHDPAFMHAVSAFQRAHAGLVVDGLIGPKTRAAIAEALPQDEFGMGYLAAVTTSSRTAHLSSGFFYAVEQMAARMRARGANVTALDFMNAWLNESGIGRVMQGHGGLRYFGLNMMMESNLPGLGFNGGGEAFAALGAEGQVPYIEKFYEQNVRQFLGGDWSRLNTATALYLMNFLPAYTKHADEPDFVLTRKGDRTGWWEANPVFDPTQKGWIQVSDLTDTLERVKQQNAAYWAEVVARAQAEGGTAPPSTFGKVAGAVVAGTLILAVLGAGVLAAKYGPARAREIAARNARAYAAPLVAPVLRAVRR